MIMDYEIHHKLEEVVDHQIYAQSQLYPLHVPIVTLNVIDNLKNTYSYSRYKQAIDFKIQTLNIYQERKISNNGRLLNILLYILAMLGSAQTLQVLQTEKSNLTTKSRSTLLDGISAEFPSLQDLLCSLPFSKFSMWKMFPPV